jgi:UDP-glucuronate 4-epimerase
MNILVTGAAGYIGSNFSFEISKKFKNFKIITIDNINDYYSKKIKLLRVSKLKKNKNIEFYKLDICNKKKIEFLFKKYNFKEVYHFAAQAGVRYSEINPQAYIDSNITGFVNIISACINYKIKKFFYASSSSVYGDNKDFPLKENSNLKPKSFYALSKKFNEEIAQIYFKNYNFKSVGLRFFTVIGEAGRPDMLINKYLNRAFNNNSFFLNNNGKGVRDFTYVKDVTQILLKLRKLNIVRNEIYNICSNKPESLVKVIKILKKNSPKFKIEIGSKQKIDVYKTHGDNSKIKRIIKKLKFKNFDLALMSTIEWYKKNHNLLK